MRPYYEAAFGQLGAVGIRPYYEAAFGQLGAVGIRPAAGEEKRLVGASGVRLDHPVHLEGSLEGFVVAEFSLINFACTLTKVKGGA